MSKIARAEFDVMPDDVVKDTGMYCYLIATCNKYHNMLDKNILLFLRLTYDKRREYYAKVKNNELHKQLSETTSVEWKMHPTMPDTVDVNNSVWHMLLKEAVWRNNKVAVEWLVKERGVEMDVWLTFIASGDMRHWLIKMGCPVLKVHHRVVISGQGLDGVEGMLVAFQGCDGIVVINENLEVKTVNVTQLSLSKKIRK